MTNEKEVVSVFHTLIAPNIIGNELAKRIVTLQVFSNPSQGEKLHILLTGEPASGKTMIGFDVARITPSSSYSASNLTRVGLLEKLIASNGGILVIDEFGRLNKNVRDGLLEAMQTGTVSIDKYGEHKRYEAKTNILAISNPKSHNLIKGLPIFRQLPYGPALLSRFHVIIPFWSVDTDLYPDIARNMLSDSELDKKRILKMRDLVVSIKSKIPTVHIDEDLAMEIGEFVKIQKMKSFMKDTISPRLIEGIISMVKANARINLRNKVKQKDLNYVFNLIDMVDRDVEGR